jgi:hypothetical protein
MEENIFLAAFVASARGAISIAAAHRNTVFGRASILQYWRSASPQWL